MMLSIVIFSHFRHMRTHTRYELQDSTSIEENPPGDTGDPNPGPESPHPGSLGSHPGSLGSGAGPSRSISSESADIPMPTHPPPPLPPSAVAASVVVSAVATAAPPPLPGPPSGTGQAAVLQRQQPLTKPPSPMDTEEESGGFPGSSRTSGLADKTGNNHGRPTMERSCTS